QTTVCPKKLSQKIQQIGRISSAPTSKCVTPNRKIFEQLDKRLDCFFEPKLPNSFNNLRTLAKGQTKS
ncbi:MAG: hypothetical protein NZ805_12170, partial [Armatimonadetes bacterium]|nr:hypothetical protein [Armatimonadota bacterium]